VPWAVVTATFMTEAVAYPLATWALFCVWRVAARPEGRALAVALAAIALATLGRSVMVLLVAMLAAVLVVVAVPYHGPAAWRARRAWTPRAVAPWALLAAAVLLVLALYVVDRGALDPLTGVYSTSLSANLDVLPRLMRDDLGYVLSGLGVLPGIVGLAWVGRNLVRPTGPDSLALALIVVLTTLLAAYSTMRAGPDERYIMYLAPPLIVAAAVAIGRRQIGVMGLALATAATVWLFSAVPWRQDGAGYDFYVSAAQIFHGRVLLLGVGQRLPDLGVSDELILAVAIVIGAAVLALALTRLDRVGRACALAVGGGLLILQVAQLLYVERHFTREAQFGAVSLADRAWVDRAAGGHDDPIGVFVTRTGPDAPNLYESWREVAFFSESPRTVFQVAGSVALDPLYGGHEMIYIDERTGRLSAPVPIPRLLLELQITPKAPLFGETLAYGDYVQFSLVRTQGPPRLKWFVSGSDDASWTVPGQPTRIRVFRTAGTGDCLTLALQPPETLTEPRAVTVRSGSAQFRVTVPPKGDAHVANVRLVGGDAEAFSDVTIDAEGATPVLGAPRGVRLASIVRGPCS
jgi:hypothetical protein